MRLIAELIGGALIAIAAFYTGYIVCWSQMSNAPPPKKEDAP